MVNTTDKKVVYNSETYFEQMQDLPESLIVKGLKPEIENQSFKLYKFSSVTINLFNSKGDSVTAPVVYVPSADFSDKKNLPQGLQNKILITDHLDGNLYPLISALDVAGIIAGSIQASLYREIIILTVPIGIISGFGDLKQDEKLVKYLKSIEGEIVWFDTIYSRLVVPTKKAPAWIKTYKWTIPEA